MNGQATRIVYLDVVNSIALILVIVIHLVAYGVTMHPVGSSIWIRANWINGPAHIAVPLFVMVSGALLLKPESQGDVRSFSKRVVRIVAAFAFWSLVYAIADCLTQDVSPASLVWRIATGSYHLWFMFMIAVLYALAPLICSVANSDYAWYVIGICFFATFIPTCAEYLMNVPALQAPALVVDSWAADMRFDAGLLGYFLLGRRLHIMVELKSGHLVFALAAFVFGAVITIVGTQVISENQGAVNEYFYQAGSPGILLMATACFVLFKMGVQDSSIESSASSLRSPLFQWGSMQFMQALSSSLRMALWIRCR